MKNEYIYIDNELTNLALSREIANYSTEKKLQVYILKRPLGEDKYEYNIQKSYFILIPKHKIILINEGDSDSSFEEYKLDLIEDLSSISDKFNYRLALGRSRDWGNDLISTYTLDNSANLSSEFVKNLLDSNKLNDAFLQKRANLLISLLSGSINDIDRIGKEVPSTVLDLVKRKIQLFDGEQTRFIYSEPESKRITIQGLSGTGKTELLLHRLKEIYVNNPQAKIIFTCHNKILASSLRSRIPEFFNFMRVQQQIEWNERLWCVHAWGSRANIDSGTLRYICFHYGIKFRTFFPGYSFDSVCKETIEDLKKIGVDNLKKPFDYIFIDESQDFPKSFFDLCDLVSNENIYIAGDIFQSIFDENIVSEVEPDFLLSKCYRTDPKTLMFAHALGMGLFEKKRLRWLEDAEWKACGYKISKEGNQYELRREPLRRFEDIPQENFTSISLVRSSLYDQSTSTTNSVITIIDQIIQENPTVSPSDIGVTFSGSSKSLYSTADRIEFAVREKYGWEVNKAYETKRDDSDTLFISNKNNVKGLEFPFLICFTNRISDAPHERNALYMLLTRSFIKSYLVVSDLANENKMRELADGLSFINREGYMKLEKPSPEDNLQVNNTKIKQKERKRTLEEMTVEIFNEWEVDQEVRRAILSLMHKSKKKFETERSVREFVEYNLENLLP